MLVSSSVASRMTRYFSFEFIDEDEVCPDTDWTMKGEAIDADGVVYGVIPKSDESISRLHDELLQSSASHQRFLFILPKKYKEITEIIQEFNAVSLLREQASGDKILFDEYEVVYEDLREVISDFISTYTHPENFKSTYIYMGEEKSITRKAALTGLLSDICDDAYSLTPVVNNEAINRNDITSIASNSRSKIIAGLGKWLLTQKQLEQQSFLREYRPQIRREILHFSLAQRAESLVSLCCCLNNWSFTMSAPIYLGRNIFNCRRAANRA